MDELPPNARAFLDAIAHSDNPSAEERARADAHVRAALRDAGLGDLPPLAARSWLAAALQSKLALLAGALIGGGILAAVLLRPHAPPSPAVTSQAPLSAQLPVAPPPSRAPNVEPSVAAPAPAQPSFKARASAAPATKLMRATQDDDGLQRELRVVASADALIRAHHFAEALRVLGTNENAASVLHEERTALRILAWCGERPDERALRAREHFLQTSPEAVLATRVREACMPVSDGSQ